MDSTAHKALGTQISSTNCCHGRHKDSTAQLAPRDSEIMNELLSPLTHGFDSSDIPTDLENINELLSRVRHGFGSPNSH
jgi:hypothetical protein